MAALLGFIGFMFIVALVFVGAMCKTKVVKKLTPAEEKQFEIDDGDISRHPFVLDLVHPEQ